MVTGSFTCLLGPNGAGKSTLMRTMAGFLPPVSGTLELLGTPPAGYGPAALARTVAVVLTDRVNVEALRVRSLVALGRSPYTGMMGTGDPAGEEAVAEALRLTGTKALAERELNTLSDGERQKVMIAKALAQQTPVMLLDEPTAFLDFPSKVEMMLLLRRLAHGSGKTILLSTHDVELALATADSLWLLDRNTGLRAGTPGELSANGSIAGCFNRPGITYDAATRRFLISD